LTNEELSDLLGKSKKEKKLKNTLELSLMTLSEKIMENTMANNILKFKRKQKRAFMEYSLKQSH
jgi:hypothetical protein